MFCEMALNEKWFLLIILVCGAISADEGPLCRSTVSSTDCQEGDSSVDEYFFTVKGHSLKIVYGSNFLHLPCPTNVSLESDALPVFNQEVIVNKVFLSGCEPPARGYGAALRALNISARTSLKLDGLGPGGLALRAEHFTGLGNTELEIEAAPGVLLSAETTFLKSSVQLIDLKLTNVSVTADTLLQLPHRLKTLTLKGTGIDRVPVAALAHLPDLETLILTETRLVEVNLTAAPALSVVQLSAPVRSLTLGPAVRELTLIGARGAELRGNCSTLRKVTVDKPETPLPTHWLAGCPRVASVLVSGEGAAPAANEWRGAAGLVELDLHALALRALPTDWLADTVQLRRLDLSYNQLEFLPQEVFRPVERLRWLDLSHNLLRHAATEALAPLVALEWLSLSHNPLGDLCRDETSVRTNTVSMLWSLVALQELELAHTGASRLCPDWRVELPSLRTVDLRGNNISVLTFEDTQWSRAGGALVHVDLRGIAVRALRYSRQQYAAALAAPAAAPLRLQADWALRCECGEYWAARALREAPQHAPSLATARCIDGDLLLERDDASLACTAPDACPAGCACATTPLYSTLSCAGAGLTWLPHAVPPLPPTRILRAAHNNLTTIAPLDALYNLTLLDVSDNHISNIDVETTAVLFANSELRVLLAGNPLRCDCGALPLLRAVAKHPQHLPDLHRARCADGRALATAAASAVANCTRPPPWVIGAAPALLVLLTAVLGAIVLTRPAVRVRIKIFLFERGLCLRWLLRPLADDDDERAYDAFVSFSHRDAQYARELSARLEGGARALRLCLHERDWTPGEWIPTQIAESVRTSRRTLVLLSENFLASDWALAELREAYAAALGEHRPRLLVVLLPGLEPASAPLTPELRAYLAAVTYLRWDDPRFWDKLRLALPPPRVAAAPAPASPPKGPPPALAAPRAPHPTPTAA